MLQVLSVDIGTINYTCCAVNFSEARDLRCVLGKPVAIRGTQYASVDIVDVFNVNIGAGVRGLRALDALTESWDSFVLFQVWEPHVVLIENQFRKASVNYALSICTYTLVKRSFPKCSVHFVKPLSKFTGYKRFFPCENDRVVLKTYKQRKDAAVALSCRLLQEFFGVTSLGEVWRSEGSDDKVRKLDDSADSFLQAFCVV